MNAPIAYTVHPGGRAPDAATQQALARWLPANGINPTLVSVEHPVTVLPVPYEGNGDGPWMIQVIVFEQIHTDHTGAPDYNLITGRKVTFQRTVPLRVPFPTAASDGEDHGEADREEAEAPTEDIVRDQGEAGVSDRHQGEGEECPGQGEAARNEGAAEGRSVRSDEAVSESEEDQQEEVGAA